MRALYFVLAGYLAGLRYLKPGLAVILTFVGAKMLLVDLYKIPALASLGVILTILTCAIVASLRANSTTELPAVPSHQSSLSSPGGASRS